MNWTLKGQLGLEVHGGRVLSGLWGRGLQRLLALNAAIWRNWACGVERKRSVIHYGHFMPTPTRTADPPPSSKNGE